MSDLARRFRRLIERHGPMPVSRFMGESNAHYYSTRDPLGATGDFVTAPDISQMFGEMIGLWCADLWHRAGRPQDLAYVELGPGRATLAIDALRAMNRQGLLPRVHFVEGSPALREIQRNRVPGATFHDDLADLPGDVPMLLVANEFLDALPIRQLVRVEKGWRERMVGLVDDRLAFVAGDQPMGDAGPADLADQAPGAVIETSPPAATVMGEVAARLAAQGGAALFVDYGHLAARTGSTLQAVKGHRKVGVLDHPGEADLTAHVDFATLAVIARTHGVAVQSGTQGQFLSALGIDTRARALAVAAPARAKETDAALRRLTAVDEMGELFKVMALTGRGWPQGAGLAAQEFVAQGSDEPE
ncbi:class I SAM-dependent methyltransferase [Qipengyuania spongiae]|uniref:SAM-dependent methyltransferase n=1 Tax=Qipengyuania spongiae TaxID=2909673 RepID=A0ABY5T393_9SPHN|nr:SAM-dependent methyltransferase [Qipengyuania spongiae]UVI39756.1 SAM-dependent methyltransferase [Qipengyuania spongiae]